MAVSVLFASENSIYKQLNNIDVWDKDRNALLFRGDNPIIAHPPCRAWASLRHCAKPEPNEKDLAYFAIEKVRLNGGVLEHPSKSTLWAIACLPEISCYDKYGGWTLVIDQFWFGHRAQKRTKLYICGCKPKNVPKIPIRLGKATHTVGLWSGRNRQTCRPSILKKEYEATPEEFAEWLIKLAEVCKHPY
jgi:hypothetical protein